MENPLTLVSQPAAFSKYLYSVSVYSLLVCALYLWGYWSTFDVNILQYSEISGLLKLAALPVIFGSASLIVGTLIGHFIFSEEPSAESRTRAQSTAFARFLRNHPHGILACWIAGTMLFAVFGPSDRWQLLPALIAMPISLFLWRRDFGADIIPDKGVRNTLVFLGVMAIPFAYAEGLRAAEAIESGAKFSYVLSPVEGITVATNAKPEERPRFLGHVADFLFFYSPGEKTVSIAKFNDEKSLTLKRFVKASPEFPSSFIGFLSGKKQ